MSLIVPAILPTSREDLEHKLALLSSVPSIRRVQIDIVDGKFASPASWPYSAEATQGKPYSAPKPYAALKALAPDGLLPHVERFEYEVDLMCFDADRMADAWLSLGASRITFHLESAANVEKLMASVRRRHGAGGFTPLVSFGLALNIATDLSLLEPHLDTIDYVQFMGIAKIGRQGQPFSRQALDKIRAFRRLHPDIPIQVDGGVSLATARELSRLSIPTLIVGSAIVRSADPAAAVRMFEEELHSPYGV